MTRYLLLILIFLYSKPLSAQQFDSKQKIIAHYDSILTKMPREKLYAHFDKFTYLNTDTIWFKAYLVNASLNIPSNLSSLIYIELINENGEIVKNMCLPTTLGVTWAGIAMNKEKFKPGNYTFRAYTNWMQNFGNTYFFNKELKIIAVNDKVLTMSNSSTIKNFKVAKIDTLSKEKANNIDIQFLPEGGSLITNRTQKIAFKVLNIKGKGINITGQVIDQYNNIVSSFSSNDKGMGYLSLLPKDDYLYTANINYNGQTKSIQLPKAKSVGTSLKVENEYGTDSIIITAFSTLPNHIHTVIGQARGVICFVANIRLNGRNHQTIKVAKNIFPTGVCQITLFDAQKKIMNERNFFINHNDALKLTISETKSIYNLRDSIPLQIKVTDVFGKSGTSSFSIAVTDDHQVAKDSTNDVNILSYFLMNSDLKGEIENSSYYFLNQNQQKHNDLEALMLTQGWVSYDWDVSKKPTFEVEREFTISGKVNNILNKPLSKAKILMLGTHKKFMLMETSTNEKGEFVFNNLPMLDSASFVIQAKNEKGRTGTAGIMLNEFKPPSVPILPQKKLIFVDEKLDSISKNLASTKIEEYQLNFKDGLLLNEVTIVGKRTIKNSKNLNGAGEADLIINEADLDRIPKKTLYHVLVEKVKGFREGYMSKSINKTFFINFNVLRLIIDGIELDFFYSKDEISNSYYDFIKSNLDYYTAEDIKGIELLDSRRFSGAYRSKFIDPRDPIEYSFLEITTKTGQGPFLKKAANMYLYKPMNYGDNKVFYSPKYSSSNKSSKTPDFRSTIYWNPNLLTNENGEGKTSFFAADKPGSYTIWIEGTDFQGNFGFKTQKITIK